MGSVMRTCGIASPDGVAIGGRIEEELRELRFEIASEANSRIRAELELRGAEPELIEAVVDQVIAASGLEDEAD